MKQSAFSSPKCCEKLCERILIYNTVLCRLGNQLPLVETQSLYLEKRRMRKLRDNIWFDPTAGATDDRCLSEGECVHLEASNQTPRKMNWPPTRHISRTGIITLNNFNWMDLSHSGEADLPSTCPCLESPTTSATTGTMSPPPTPIPLLSTVLCPVRSNLHFPPE